MIALLARLGVAERYRGVLAIMIGLVLLVAATALLSRCAASWVAGERDEAVQVDRADAVSEATTRVLAADRGATANQVERDTAFQNLQEELEDVAREADNGAGVGPATSSVLERMREQQAAGRRGGAAR